MACTILASESPLTHDEYTRMCHARDILGMSSLLIQLGTAWLVLGGVAAPKRMRSRILQVLIALAGSVLYSLIAGLLLFGIAEHRWYRIAGYFK